ncbi:HAD family hydrolase [Pseudozobellia thermophila]|uniref:Putative hydrolase of the HAD superfamily n=1 Tax=Pseudozobellia thermophila TaxID=192903 RepID=A0A1M6FB34_9FLAO|nr:HAD family phosphatase [Pseudozobellia thermophila]SHI94819.1 putative hydrolase of the HAD superfamily [Pseudozobellia thermophila]
MIKNIIFDFGDVFINLDKEIIFREMIQLGASEHLGPELIDLNNRYEVGQISTEHFISRLSAIYPSASPTRIVDIWNGMLLDFPDERLHFIEDLARQQRYRLFLLSNTNELHIEHVQKIMGKAKFDRFKNAFEKFYLSHEIKLRKPSSAIYQFVLEENGLKAEETFFIDDTQENTRAAEKLGIRCWNLRVGKDDIVQLKSRL